VHPFALKDLARAAKYRENLGALRDCFRSETRISSIGNHVHNNRSVDSAVRTAVVLAGQSSDDELRRTFAELGFITVSNHLIPVLRQAGKAARVSDITVLLEGETGTGKQVLAYAIHRLDQKRKSFRFVTVHCSTINDALAESEFFGHERGAFSGAAVERKGLFQTAHRGTLFLDDVNDLPPALQPKLLDVLQRGMVRAVGSDREVPVDVRIISACNRPLRPMIQQSRFRADLYHRLNVVNLSLPPLRERPQDLATLILAFALRHSYIFPGIASIQPQLVQFLERQPFDGNVRELEHAVERMLFAKTEGTSLGLSDWMAQASDEDTQARDWIGEAADRLSNAIFERGLAYRQAIQQIETRALEIALRRGGETRREIAARLQISERTLYHKMRVQRARQVSVDSA
jgi:transcriptional regulator with PAS, ATPase and Fis domain